MTCGECYVIHNDLYIFARRKHVAMKQPQKTKSYNLIGLHKNKTADTAKPRKRSIVTRPFSSLALEVPVGSGHETI